MRVGDGDTDLFYAGYGGSGHKNNDRNHMYLNVNNTLTLVERGVFSEHIRISILAVGDVDGDGIM